MMQRHIDHAHVDLWVLDVERTRKGRRATAALDEDDAGCRWVSLEVTVSVDDDVKTECSARIAVPTTPDDNPWARRGDSWKP